MLAIIAGQGALPGIIKASLDEEPLTASLEGFDPEGFTADIRFRIETLGSLLNALIERGVHTVCFAGGIARPKLNPSAIDAATLPLVPRMMSALQAGDDAALRTVLEIFEEAGLKIVAASELVPSLLPASGVLSVRQVDDQHHKDAERASDIAAALGALDLGQSCVVRNGQALGLEAMPGTDHMLASVANASVGQGGLFYKAMKPQQDYRVDMPVVGVETVERCAAAKLDGLVIQAQGVMVLDLDSVVQSVDAAGLFFWVRSS